MKFAPTGNIALHGLCSMRGTGWSAVSYRDNPGEPPGFVVRTEAQKAAFDNGFRIELGIEGGWMRYASATAWGEIWIAGISFRGPWLLSVSHAGVAAELGTTASDIEGPGLARFVLLSLQELYAAVARAYRLGVSLPQAPLEQFRSIIHNLPQTTDAERLVVQRVGQDVFRRALLKYWTAVVP
jgi:hypothetical protein